MSHTLSQRQVEETIERNERLIESADDEARELREARAKSAKIARRARRSLKRLSRRHSTAA
jgi:hypothetical protein